MIEDMAARKLNPHTQRSHISSCKRFAAWLKRSPDTATADEVRRFQLHLIESGASICNRNRIMTGVRFLFRVTLRRHDLAAEIWHLKEPQTLPPVLSPEDDADPRAEAPGVGGDGERRLGRRLHQEVIPWRRRERVKTTNATVTKRSFPRKLRDGRDAQRHALRFDSDALNLLTARENGVSCVRRHG